MRVNLDLSTQTIRPNDLLSVEMAIAQAERSVDYNLIEFSHNEILQSLADEIKLR